MMGQPQGMQKKPLTFHITQITVIFPILGADPTRFGSDREKRSTAFNSALKILLNPQFFYDGVALKVCRKSHKHFALRELPSFFRSCEPIPEDSEVIEEHGQRHSIQH